MTGNLYATIITWLAVFLSAGIVSGDRDAASRLEGNLEKDSTENAGMATCWITPDPADYNPQGAEERRPTWWMRRCLALDAIPAALELEIVCLGYYELYVNGEQVDPEPLAPSLTRLDRRAFSLRHDIAPYLKPGRNCIAIWCSSGWYLPHQFSVHKKATPLLRISLPQAWTGDAKWLCHKANRSVIGPWKWNKFGGEEVDARKARPDWNLSTCEPTGWHVAREVSAPPIEITPRDCPPNRIGETYAAKSVRRLKDGRFEVDFGTCLAGWVDIRFGKLAKGQSVTLRFYDLPADNDRGKDHSFGQVSIYHAAGDGEDCFVNRFNYAGFRYMTLEGLDEPPVLEDIKALLVETAVDRVGSFRCSNELFNRIHELNVHTLRCLNLGGYSVDCPHRERMGYGADGQTALPAYLYIMDSMSFLKKWLRDWCDVYEPDSGRISCCAPNIHKQHAPAWGGIVAPLAWDLYLYYGDRESMERALPVIRGYLRFLQNAVRDGVIRKDLLGSKFHADWVPPRRGMDSGNRPDKPMRELFNSCYLIHIWEIYSDICEVLGRKDDIPEAERNIALLREGVHREFYDEKAGLYLMPEQAYQAMPLLAGVVPDELVPAIEKKLVELIRSKDWHMDTGLPGTTLLLDVLEANGEHEVISRIYNQETYPGWGYMLANGATAIWEQWNGYWSQIHSCFAGPAAWFYTGLAGIRPDEAYPGFERFTLAPAFLADLTFVEASYASVRGKIVSSWHRKDGVMTWSVTIPKGVTANLAVPLADADSLLVNGKPWTGKLQKKSGVKKQPTVTFELSNGDYELQWTERDTRAERSETGPDGVGATERSEVANLNREE